MGREPNGDVMQKPEGIAPRPRKQRPLGMPCATRYARGRTASLHAANAALANFPACAEASAGRRKASPIPWTALPHSACRKTDKDDLQPGMAS